MKRLEEKVTYFRPSPPADLQWPGVLFSAGTSVCTTQVYVYAGSGMMRVSRGFISLRPMQLQPCDSSHLLLAGAGPVISFYLKGFLLMFKSSPCLWKSLSFEKLGALPECPPFPARPVGGASLLRKPGQQAPTAAVPVLAYMSGKSSARRIPGRVPQSSKACSCFREGLTFLTWQSQRVRSSELERLTVRAGEAMTTRLTDFTDKEVDAGIFFFLKQHSGDIWKEPSYVTMPWALEPHKIIPSHQEKNSIFHKLWLRSQGNSIYQIAYTDYTHMALLKGLC